MVPHRTSKTARPVGLVAFAIEPAGHGIRANTLEPGFRAGQHGQRAAGHPLPREDRGRDPASRPTRPSPIIANGPYYLASEGSSFVTGSTLTIDGGNLIGSAPRCIRPRSRRSEPTPAIRPSPHMNERRHLLIPWPAYAWPEAARSAFCFTSRRRCQSLLLGACVAEVHSALIAQLEQRSHGPQ